MQIGVLALQGAFREHLTAIEKCGHKAVQIKFADELNNIQGLIIPGGESTTMVKLIKKYEFRPALDRFFKSQKPIFGTCAGLILLASRVENLDYCLGYINIDVDRNAYGRQIDSFEQFVELNPAYFPENESYKAVFIRAPRIIKAGAGVQVLSSIKGEAIMARQNNILVCSFHPELTDDLRIHRYFINMVKDSINMVKSS
ncbi:MAG: pyridoxal 5'-phosphate synthase glutaminase subunit PdxT [Actinobacteria bacterium]|nr:pyridoxal 5'-phosphate synthase glutaminase subunit PdxT [Actinomycetota bacterium]